MFNFNMSLKELYDVILEICVNNSNKMRSDSLIGSFKLDLGSVHEQPGRLIICPSKTRLINQSFATKMLNEKNFLKL